MQIFKVKAIGAASIAFVFGFVLLACAIAFGALFAIRSETYFMAWFVLGVTVLVAAALFVQLLVVRIVVSDDRLVIGGGLYSLTVSRQSLRTAKIRSQGSTAATDLGYRINGVGMPGLALGWFQPKRGKKVFALVTSSSPVIYIPTALPYDLALSPVDGDRFLAAVRAK